MNDPFPLYLPRLAQSPRTTPSLPSCPHHHPSLPPPIHRVVFAAPTCRHPSDLPPGVNIVTPQHSHSELHGYVSVFLSLVSFTVPPPQIQILLPSTSRPFPTKSYLTPPSIPCRCSISSTYSAPTAPTMFISTQPCSRRTTKVTLDLTPSTCLQPGTPDFASLTPPGPSSRRTSLPTQS